MKQIIPFKKDLLFKTKVSEVTSISLEHNFKIDNDIISGNFNISGDYKMTEGSINREKFNFDLPFDIALDSRYDKNNMVVDIDNFYYQIINSDTLEVHIDLYVDGEKLVEVEDRDNNTIKFEDLVKEVSEQKEIIDDISNVDDDSFSHNIEYEKFIRKDDLMDNEIVFEAEVEESKNINNNININQNLEKNKDFNVFDNVDDSETYRAYYVYIVKEGDTIDKILEKYNITKDELALYNNIENIKMGDKIIIPSKNE